jgi:WASH complex subunit 7
MYPYERAFKVNRALKSLVDDTNYLELVRERITQIGNTLGYVRMIKNASLKDNQNLLKFIPKFLDEFDFESLAEELVIGGETMESVKMFDHSVQLMQKQSDDANDYLRNMVKNNEGFADRDEKTLPLKNFYGLIPAISITHVEHIQKGRDRLSKKNNVNAFISDDGFPLGCVFLLKILGVSDQFSTLNWFDSVQAKFTADKAEAEAKIKGKKAPGAYVDQYEDDQAFEEELSLKRIDVTRKEFQLLQYTMTASAILFKEI